MTTFKQTSPIYNTDSYSYQQNQKADLSHKQLLEIAIQQELEKCQQIYSTKMQGIVEQWKRSTINNYRQIIEKVDKSLIDEINRIICEQINIEKEQIIQLISQMGKEILKNTKQTTKQHKNKEKPERTVQMEKSKEKSYSLVKTRSISGDNSRRKLSKGLFFAQAKKINMDETINSRYLSKTNPLSGFNNAQKEGGKVKKLRRKDDNCFDFLQKCNKTTSPSNIMINYINAKEAAHSTQLEHYNLHQKPIHQNHTIQVNGKEVFNQNIQNKKIQALITPIQNSIKVQSQTYKRLMVSFQEKITNKLDLLMGKYTKLEQKLQTNTQKPVQSIIYNRISQNNQNIASIEASMINLPQKSKNTLQKEKMQEIQQKKLNEVNKTGKENDDSKAKTVKQQQIPRKSIKAIEHHNKIIKNKSNIIQNFAQSLEQISLQKQKPLNKNESRTSVFNNTQKQSKQQKQLKQRQNLQLIQRQLKEQDKIYFQTLILQFYTVTQKVILPISKQLLYVLVHHYQQYCEINSFSNRNKQITSLQTKKLEIFQQQFNDLLNKIQKVIDSKCQPSKKEKLLMYFSKFIQAASLYDAKSNIFSKDSEYKTENQLKEKINKIKLSLTK